MCIVFSPGGRKNDTQKTESTMLPQAKTALCGSPYPDNKGTFIHAPARIYDYQRIPLRPPIRITLGNGACAALPTDAADLYHHCDRHGGGAKPGGCVRRPGV